MAQANHVSSAIRAAKTAVFGIAYSPAVLATHAQLLASQAVDPPRAIPAGVRTLDVGAPADRLADALAIFRGLASNVTGAAQYSADTMAGGLA